jgi:hypothetical protein
MWSLVGGFSPRPSEWSISWMIVASAWRLFLDISRTNREPQMRMARLPGVVTARPEVPHRREGPS